LDCGKGDAVQFLLLKVFNEELTTSNDEFEYINYNNDYDGLTDRQFASIGIIEGLGRVELVEGALFQVCYKCCN